MNPYTYVSEILDELMKFYITTHISRSFSIDSSKIN